MKQVLLDPRSGKVSLVETPAPSLSPDRLLVRTEASVLSSGTERQLIALSSRSLVGKARARPEAARQVIEAVRREGVRSAMWKAQARLDHPFPLGYSLAGTVLEVGSDLSGPAPGTRVACAGAEIATHSEIVSVPPLLAVPVPDGVPTEEAAFSSIGAIAMHAVRLAGVEPGGQAAVLGLGLLGQLAVQILAASGTWTLGVDPVLDRRELAESVVGCATSAGGEAAVAVCEGRGGMDAVIVAVAGGGPDIMAAAIDMARDRGRLVVIGTPELSLDRERMYRKELSLVVARSSGAGRYDPTYEMEGVDLPAGHVRWTVGRNMAAFLELLRQEKLFIGPLVSHRFPIAEAERAYALLGGKESSLAIVLDYETASRTAVPSGEISLERVPARASRDLGIAVIGAGTFARSVLLPRLQRLPVRLEVVATTTGPSALGSARRFGFARAGTDAHEAMAASGVDAVVVATRHDLHSALAAEALRAGRGVYVEKPLALDRQGLVDVLQAWKGSGAVLSVGFNRRFAPLVRRLRAELKGPGLLTASYVVNVASIQPDSWILDPRQGGGVILGEGGHFIDTLMSLIGSLPVVVSAVAVDETSYQATVRFEDGSTGAITYTTGARGHGPKELLTVAGRGVLAQLHDFQGLSIWRGARRRRIRSRHQDKGHSTALEAWIRGIRAGRMPVPILQITAATEATICLHEAVRSGEPVPVDLSPYLRELQGASG